MPQSAEEEPLLAHEQSREDSRLEAHNVKHVLYNRILLVILLLVTTVGSANPIVVASSTRIFEMVYCRDHFLKADPSLIGPDGTVPEEFCKIEPVQSRVSSLNGGRDFFQNLPTLITAIVYGYMADQVGRRPLMLLGVLLMALRATLTFVVCLFAGAIDLRFVWSESVFVLFGGGEMVLVALLFTILSDVTNEQNKAEAFFKVVALGQVSNTLAPFIAASLMKFDPRIALFVAVVVAFLGVAICLALPETLPRAPPGATADTIETDHETRGVASVKKALRKAFSAVQFLFEDWRLLAVGGLYVFRVVNIPLDTYTLQYLPQRYSIDMADAAYFISAQAIFAAPVLWFVIPALTKHLLNHAKRPWSAEDKDVLLMRLGLLFSGLGWVFVGISPNIQVLTVGLGVLALAVGTGAALRAAASTWIEPDRQGLLMGFLAIAETVGLTAGGPVIAQLYNAGLRTDNPDWYGLPWVVFGVIGLLTTLVAVLLRWSSSPRHSDSEDVDGLGSDPVERTESE